MYHTAFEEQIFDKLNEVLGGPVSISFYAGQLVDKESVMSFAERVQVRPNLLINVAPSADKNQSDSTNRVDKETVIVEVIVATYDPRSLRHQRSKALEYVFGTRKALQGLNLTSDYTAASPMVFQGYREDFNVNGLCVYTTVLNVEVTIDLDEI